MDEQQWSDAVRVAWSTQDRAVLRRLFDAAVEAWGHDVASGLWFRLMGEADAGAQTG